MVDLDLLIVVSHLRQWPLTSNEVLVLFSVGVANHFLRATSGKAAYHINQSWYYNLHTVGISYFLNLVV